MLKRVVIKRAQCTAALLFAWGCATLHNRPDAPCAPYEDSRVRSVPSQSLAKLAGNYRLVLTMTSAAYGRAVDTARLSLEPADSLHRFYEDVNGKWVRRGEHPFTGRIHAVDENGLPHSSFVTLTQTRGATMLEFTCDGCGGSLIPLMVEEVDANRFRGRMFIPKVGDSGVVELPGLLDPKGYFCAVRTL